MGRRCCFHQVMSFPCIVFVHFGLTTFWSVQIGTLHSLVTLAHEYPAARVQLFCFILICYSALQSSFHPSRGALLELHEGCEGGGLFSVGMEIFWARRWHWPA